MYCYIYFDMELLIFVFSSSKQQEKRYILLSTQELYHIAQQNVADMKRYIIKKEYTNSFIYHSTKELKRLSIPEEYTNTKKSLYHKPQGIWISCGISWLNYIEQKIKEPHKWNLFSYTYKIELFDSVKIISEKEELHKFIKKYKKKPDDIRLYDVIDWELVKREYNGLVITPYLGNKIWRESNDVMKIHGAESAHDFFVDLLGSKWKNNMLLLSEWYRSWECACGVIWNLNGIASFKLLKKTNFTKYLL